MRGDGIAQLRDAERLWVIERGQAHVGHRSIDNVRRCCEVMPADFAMEEAMPPVRPTRVCDSGLPYVRQFWLLGVARSTAQLTPPVGKRSSLPLGALLRVAVAAPLLTVQCMIGREPNSP